MSTRIVKDHGLKVGTILESLEMDGITRKAYTFYEVTKVHDNGKIDMQALETGYLGLHKEVPVIGSNYGQVMTKNVRTDSRDGLGLYVSVRQGTRAYSYEK